MKATSRTGDSPVNLGDNGAASVHVNSSEDHGVNGTSGANAVLASPNSSG
jgi:hypothetical protein